jgi:hypothetical protein
MRDEQYNISQKNFRYIEIFVKPISLLTILILWIVTICIILLSINHHALFNSDDSILFQSIILLISLIFTFYFVFFKGIRYLVYEDRIEFQKGKTSSWEILSFDYLSTIVWDISIYGSEYPIDTAFIELIFIKNQKKLRLRLYKLFDLNSPIAQKCKNIEKEYITSTIITKINEGKTISFYLPQNFSPIQINTNGIMIPNNDQILWKDIRVIQLLPGNISRYKNYLAQCRICIIGINGIVLEHDMPSNNPYAYWNILLMLCTCEVKLYGAATVRDCVHLCASPIPLK